MLSTEASILRWHHRSTCRSSDTPCVNCGQCINVCPVAALHEKNDIDRVWEAIHDPTKHVIVQTAPAVRVALGEDFDMPIGTPVTGKMVTALKMLGFDKVFDTDTGADLTIMEEGAELIDRIRGGGKLPLITSCSPGWIKFCEHNYPDMLDNLSTCKSPHQMFGAILKTYYAQKNDIDPKDIVVVSVMPCTAKKFEAARPEMEVDGLTDVDYRHSLRESSATMIYDLGIDFPDLAEQRIRQSVRRCFRCRCYIRRYRRRYGSCTQNSCRSCSQAKLCRQLRV